MKAKDIAPLSYIFHTLMFKNWAYQFSIGPIGLIEIPNMVFVFKVVLPALQLTVPGLLLIRLGFLPHPPLMKLIEIAGSHDPKIQQAAFKYLSDKFDELYDVEYDPTNYEGQPFIPAIKNGEDCVGTYEEVKSHQYYI